MLEAKDISKTQFLKLMSPVLLCNSHILWMCCVTEVFAECILFILSEINP